ncbi:MAG: hypothetical protein EZS28_048721, partial [Streblomastix strix]
GWKCNAFDVVQSTYQLGIITENIGQFDDA